ncbi:Peptidase M23 family protein [Sphingomonas sp. EC-HK361]|uniref:murein hydrolase activator EnvC family protein n=1 Tax=Sphingomonas sp. EC-HK361 TaxID=2038397 RepID=UPI0012514E22|nr:peptidoglycan DD-metalloendopeptidase family protein [Sphingomonas sp. EC-HK361]VVT24405.1 Peptidase M23 family protein [Sphingomonas sp. EC-HK361]
MRRGIAIAAVLIACMGGAGVWAATDPLMAQRRALAAAQRQLQAAGARSAQLERQATGERDAATAAARRKAAVEARIAGARAEIVAARARIAIIDRLLGEQRARLAVQQAPVARLLAALQSLARRPTLAAVVQPGSVDDLVHVRAVLGSTLPVIRARTIDIRSEVDRARLLSIEATRAAAALHSGEARLLDERRELAALELLHGARASTLRRSAIAESDKAIALGEAARDIVDDMDSATDQRATLAALVDLPGPPAGIAALAPPPVYRLPVRGRVVTGLGELSDAGFRARGLTLAVAPGAVVKAPASGTVRLARPFRDYGTIVIIDHGQGWTTLVTGLGGTQVRRGEAVRSGAVLGRAPTGDAPLVTVELRRQGRPMDITALAGVVP